jgi:hypothetical protein
MKYIGKYLNGEILLARECRMKKMAFLEGWYLLREIIY